MRRPTQIILISISFVLGIIFGYNFLFTVSIYWAVFVLFAVACAFLIKSKLAILPLVLAGFCIGIFAISTQIALIAQRGLSNYYYEKVDLVGTVKGDPYWDEDGNYVFLLTDIVVNNQKKFGDIRVKTFSSFAKEGYKLRVKGKIYPTLAKPGAQISFASVEIIKVNEPVLVRSKNLFFMGLDRSLNQQSANFMKGILLGSRSLLNKNIQDTLNSVGLSHIVAVSGYNLTILVVLLHQVLKRRWAWGGLIISLLVVWTFTLLVGASASISRAAIMATVFLIASYYGRPVGIYSCISITAVITLAINPSAVIEDLSWQLSFLSLIGIITISPIIVRLLPKKLGTASELLAITLAAQIATMPYIMFLFGKFSLASILSNVVLMPLVPTLMLLGFILAIIGIVFPAWAYILGAPINKIIEIIFDFLIFLQSKSYLVMNSRPKVFMLLIWYVAITALGVIVYNKRLYTGKQTFQKHPEMLK